MKDNETTVRPYDRDLVSLPGSGDEPVQLSKVLDDRGRDLVKDPLTYMLRDSEEWGDVVERHKPVKPYMDSRLQASDGLYAPRGC